MTNAAAQMTARIEACSNSKLVQMARLLQADLSDEATLVMGRVLQELSVRFDEPEFLAICADLDGILSQQSAMADPMHY